MNFHAAVPADSDVIEEFLVVHSDTSMFLRANLAAHGPCGGEARNATRMWVRKEAGMVTGVFGITTAGFVLVQIPHNMPDEQLSETLQRYEINGIFGATGQVRQVQAALGLTEAKTQLDDDEPLYSLDLTKLVLPHAHVLLREATEADKPLLAHWRASYLIEIFHFNPEEAQEMAGDDVDAMLSKQSLMLLESEDGLPLAMTSFNAILPDTVQIGNVYTPDEVRGQGHARHAVALHLDRARQDGVKRAILFASGPAASRAYEAIGFEQIGHFTLLFFADAQNVKVPA